MLPLFQDNFILGETTSSYFFFFRVSNWTQELLFRDSCFFRTVAFSLFSGPSLFRRSYFFRIAFFPERKFYRAGILYGNYSSGHLFYPEKLFRIKISKKELIFHSRYFCTVSTFHKR